MALPVVHPVLKGGLGPVLEAKSLLTPLPLLVTAHGSPKNSRKQSQD